MKKRDASVKHTLGLPVVRATEIQKALNCVVLKYSIPVSEERSEKHWLLG